MKVLQKTILEWNGKACVLTLKKRDWLGEIEDSGHCRNSSILFNLVVMDGAESTFEDQLHTIFRTAIIMGMHGAALSHQLFMAPGG